MLAIMLVFCKQMNFLDKKKKKKKSRLGFVSKCTVIIVPITVLIL